MKAMLCCELNMGYPSCMASMNYFDSDMYNSINTVAYFDWKDDNLYLRLRAMSKAFLIPHSCRATERNGNRISADVTDDN
jgi:hypothetical protein